MTLSKICYKLKLRLYFVRWFSNQHRIRFSSDSCLDMRHEVGRFTHGVPEVFDWTGQNKLVIGRYCSISTNVRIFLDENPCFTKFSTYPFDTLVHEELADNTRKNGDVVIGNDVRIGPGVMILNGVKVGDGAIITAGSVVTQDVDPYAIVGGNPSRLIKYRFDAHTISRIRALNWWDLDPDVLIESWSAGSIVSIERTRERLSVAMVIYNEAKHLEDCLASVASLTSDIVIVHDGECTDQSERIASKYGARFFTRPRLGIAEGHRIFAFEQTVGDWVLVLDADERLSQQLQKAIPFLISSKVNDAYEFIWPLFDGKEVLCAGWPRKKALFRKARIRYIDFPQAEISTEGVLCRTALTLEHRPRYNNFTWDVFKTKWLSWAVIHAERLSQDFKAIGKLGFSGQDDWGRGFKFKRRYPEFFIFYGLHELCRSLKSGGFKNRYAVKVAFMWAAYCGVVYYQASKLKWSLKP